MNRTERLYALVEELRAVAPRPRSAAWLARRFEVTPRTIERDLDALRESGVAIRGDVGRSGGYSLDRDRTLPPVTLTAGEALAIAVALRAAATTPFAAAARRAALKVRAVLPADVRRREEALTELIYRVGEHADKAGGPADPALEQAVATGRVIHLAYRDPAGTRTERDVEPMALLWGPHGWYLMAWCRLRDGIRGFQLDRVEAAEVTDERVSGHEAEFRAELDRLDAERLGL
jgi:predicted DNA-binding transcriptional regulator YafY